MARGYVSREEVSLRFRVTNKLLQLAQPRVRDFSLVECALGPMRQLRDETQETVQLGLRVDDSGVVIEQVESRQAMRISVDIGLKFKLHNNAPGKVLLAFQHPKERERVLSRLKLERYTDRTITDRNQLRLECDRVVKQGFATDWAEADEGIHCVAAPVFDELHHFLAVLWVSAPSRRLPQEEFARLGARVIETARQISRRIAHP
jgi:DNA-binding IclR family transcriptional regulator